MKQRIEIGEYVRHIHTGIGGEVVEIVLCRNDFRRIRYRPLQGRSGFPPMIQEFGEDLVELAERPAPTKDSNRWPDERPEREARGGERRPL